MIDSELSFTFSRLAAISGPRRLTLCSCRAESWKTRTVNTTVAAILAQIYALCALCLVHQDSVRKGMEPLQNLCYVAWVWLAMSLALIMRERQLQ